MYVKVHKKGNQWFRDDGTLVGKTIHNLESQVLIGTDLKSSIIADCGYVDKDSNFVPFCKSLTCDYYCLCERKPKCRYTTKDIKSSGFYISIPD